MKKKVSVIIPFYRHVDWLCDAVQSVLDQTYNNFEIIVVNDGSPENVDDFLNKYGNKIIYKYQKNEGPASARNAAIRNATGDYIAFLDSDDIWLPTKTEKQISFMEKVGAMWSHTGYYKWDYESNNEKHSLNNRDFDKIYKQTFVSIHIATPSVVIKRTALIEHPYLKFNENLRIGEDINFWRDISQYYSLALIQEPLIKVRMRGANTYANAILRFNMKAKEYALLKTSKEKPSFIIIFNYSIYNFYSKIFIHKSSKTKEIIAKCFWILPYTIERIYIKYITLFQKKDKKYKLKFKCKY